LIPNLAQLDERAALGQENESHRPSLGRQRKRLRERVPNFDTLDRIAGSRIVDAEKARPVRWKRRLRMGSDCERGRQ